MLATLTIFLDAAFWGLALSVLSVRAFSFQHEILKGSNRNAAWQVAMEQLKLAVLLNLSLPLAAPLLGVSAGFLYGLSFVLEVFPLIAALRAGAYAHIRSNLSDPQSLFFRPFEFLEPYIDDWVIANTPNIVLEFLEDCYQWLGAVYFVTQIYLLAVIAFIQPVLGLVALGFLGFSYLRLKGKLPYRVASIIESVSYWMGIASGLFLGNWILQLFALFSIITEVGANIILPWLLRYFLSADSEFLQVSKVSELPPAQRRIPETITENQMKALLRAIPLPNRVSDSKTIGDEFFNFVGTFLRDAEKDEKFQSLIEWFKKEKAQLDLRFPTIVKQLKTYYLYSRLAMAMVWRGGIRFATNYLKNKIHQGNFKLKLSHMARVPEFSLPSVAVDFKQFYQAVLASNLKQSVGVFKPNCLASSKFREIDPDLKERLVRLKQEDCRDQEIQAIKNQMIEAWKKELQLPENATEEDVIIEYVLLRLNKTLFSMETGEELLFDKTVKSLEKFREMSSHVIAYLQALVKENPTAVHSILGGLAIEAGDYCANALYAMVEQIYVEQVLPAKKEAIKNLASLTPANKLAFYLQEERHRIFEQIYYLVADNPNTKSLFLGVDFNDRHVHSSVLNGLSVLYLKGRHNAESDLSNNQRDFFEQIRIKFYAYVLAQVMMVLEHGYSPENIVQLAMPLPGGSSGLSFFEFYECCNAWIDSFKDEKVKELLGDICCWNYVDYSFPPEEWLKRMISLMFYDLEIFDFTETSQAAEQAIAEILSQPQTQVEPPVSSSVLSQYQSSRTPGDRSAVQTTPPSERLSPFSVIIK